MDPKATTALVKLLETLNELAKIGLAMAREGQERRPGYDPYKAPSREGGEFRRPRTKP